MTTKQQAELKAIADALALRSNDPVALDRFNIFVRSISPAARRDLVVVLQDMIAGAKSATADPYRRWPDQNANGVRTVKSANVCAACGALKADHLDYGRADLVCPTSTPSIWKAGR